VNTKEDVLKALDELLDHKEWTALEVAKWWHEWQKKIDPKHLGKIFEAYVEHDKETNPTSGVKLVDYRLEESNANPDGDALTLYFDGEPTQQDVKNACKQIVGKLELSSDPDDESWWWEKCPTSTSEKARLVRVQCPCA